MRAYPVITYTDPETNEVHSIQVDDHGISLDVEEIRMYTACEPRREIVTITGSGYRKIAAEDHDRALATLVRALGKEIDQLKQHAHDEYYRGLENGRRDALSKVRDLLEPVTEGDEE